MVVACLALSCAHGRPGGDARPPVPVRILAINDLHGELEPATLPDGHLAGGAAVLASWLRAARADCPAATLLVSAGDLVGHSPPLSSALQDEPTIAVMNALAGAACQALAPERALDLVAVAGDPRCDVVAAVGNHELDEGAAELLRLTRGGSPEGSLSFESPWRGARFPFVAANVIDRRSGKPVFPPAVVREVGGVRVGVVGAVFRDVAEVVDPGRVDDLVFLDVAPAVNDAVRGLVAQGVRAVVVVLHDGGGQEPYVGPTRADATPLPGRLASLVSALDGEVDVLITGHTHAFTNTRLSNAAGRPVLVTQAFWRGSAFASIDLGVDRQSGDIVTANADIVPVLGDARPDLGPDPNVERIVTAARRLAEPMLARVVGVTSQELLRRGDVSDPGEWPLGSVVADAFRAAMQADLALVQTGTLRADLPAGVVTWGQLHAVLPSGDRVVGVALTGREIKAALERQWPPPRSATSYIVDVSGLEVVWDGRRPPGDRIVQLTRNHEPVGMDSTYTVAMPSALANVVDRLAMPPRADGGRLEGPRDIDAVEGYLRSLPGPVVAPAPGRISRRRS